MGGLQNSHLDTRLGRQRVGDISRVFIPQRTLESSEMRLEKAPLSVGGDSKISCAITEKIDD